MTFDVVNDMFERIEALEGKGIPRKLHKDYASDIFPAKITTENSAAPGEYQFTEQTRFPGSSSSGNFIAINGRRSSGYLQGVFTNYATPAIAQPGLPSGSIVYLLGRDNQAGKLEYLSVSSPAQTGTGGTVALIQSATVITANLRWKYSVIEAKYFTTQNIFTSVVGATSFFAWNGAENTTDSTSKGVGFVPSSNAAAIYTRQPIKNGIAVEIIKDKNGLAMFSIPNGYKVVC